MNRLTFKRFIPCLDRNEEKTMINITGYLQYMERSEYPYKRYYYLAGEAVEKLAAYEDAEEKGLLFKMPCKPGDTVWILISSTKEIKSFKVSKITIGKNHDSITMTDKSIFTIWGKKWDKYFNRFVYPTKEAAEQALQQIQEERE